MRHGQIACCLLVASLALACDDRAVPVGSVEVDPARIELRYPGFSEYQITWMPSVELTDSGGALRAAIHLVGGDGQVLRTFDHPLDFEWTPGSTKTRLRMLFQSALAPPLEDGDYELRIGIYDSAGHGWSLATSGARVQVESGDAGFPAFYFSPEWLPIEGGADRQILGRRWLKNDGVIRLGEMTRPGTLWLQLGIPTPVEGEQEMVLDDGATGPEVTVSSSCGFSQTFAGSTSHQMRIPISAGDDGELPFECEISFEANYTLIAIEDRVHRTIALESLSWQTG